MGRYINQDPIGLMGGNNHYIYPVNPTGWIDSLGLQQACVVNFPDYPVEYAEGKTSTWLGGHSGVLTYDTSGKHNTSNTVDITQMQKELWALNYPKTTETFGKLQCLI